MTAAPPKRIVFPWKSKDIDSINCATTKKLLLDLALLSKYLRNNYPLQARNKSEIIPKRGEKNFSCQRYMFLRGNNSDSVKLANDHRASRLAHYQEKVVDNSASMRPSDRGRNLGSVRDGAARIPTTADDVNNNDQMIMSDEIPANRRHSKINNPNNTSDSKDETQHKASSNEIVLNSRSQSIGPTSNTNNRAMTILVRNRSNPETSEFPQIGNRCDSVSRHNPNSRACYLCWCCCCSCSCLNVKPKQDEPLRPQVSIEHLSKLETDERLSLEESQKWAQNFEFLMQSLAGRKIFQEFLKLEYSEENIMFYKAVEDLQAETDEGLVEEKARTIYEDYISILSPKEVSLDSRVRELINSDMVEPSSRTFDEAQLQIYTLMQRDSYPRFLNSRLYNDVRRQLGGTSTTSNSQSLSDTRQN